MVERAYAELNVKTLQQIQGETAHTWAARFFAARQLGRPAAECEEYRHEAIEHAALAGDLGLVRFLLAPR
jgi:hypothetical protein